MRTVRWMAVFVVAAIAAGWIGAQATIPTAKAQDVHIVDPQQGTDVPMLQERPLPDRPMQRGPGMMPGPQMQMNMPPAIAMWGDDKSLFVLRGDTIFRLDKQTLEIKAQKDLPRPRPQMPMGDRGPMEPGMEPGMEPPQPPR
jgi:hypothetical protein